MKRHIEILGEKAQWLLGHKCKVPKELLHIPGSDFVDRVWISSDGRLSNSGYLSILPVDQGIEHTAGSAFAPNPIYFDSENIVKLAIEGGCNPVASTFGVLGSVSRKYAHKIPFVVKIISEA